MTKKERSYIMTETHKNMLRAPIINVEEEQNKLAEKIFLVYIKNNCYPKGLKELAKESIKDAKIFYKEIKL